MRIKIRLFFGYVIVVVLVLMGIGTYVLKDNHLQPVFVLGKTHTDSARHVEAKTHAESAWHVEAKIHAESARNIGAKTHAESARHVAAKTHTDSARHVEAKTHAESARNVGAKTHAESARHVNEIVSDPVINAVNNTLFRATAHDQITCKFPVLQLNHTDIINLRPRDHDVTCTAEQNWVWVQNGTLRISQDATAKHGSITCEYKPIIRGGDDFQWDHGPPVKHVVDGFRITSDFFEVTCVGSDGQTHTNIHSAIAYRADIHDVTESDAPAAIGPDVPKPPHSPKERKAHNSGLGMDVLIIGLDSLSRLHWQRKLPQSHRYLMEELGAVNMEGLNILGDGTPPALFALLTEKIEAELPLASRHIPGAVTVDDFPWVWKHFKKAGYVTTYAEDRYRDNSFTYRLKGFRRRPSDHYARPYYMRAETAYQEGNCVGSKPAFRIAMDYINDTYIMYPNRRKFVFTFLTTYTHNRDTYYRHSDAELTSFLKRFHKDGHLTNTLLFVMSDHGVRFDDIRKSEQGKMEERLPYLSVVVPKWFRTKYPQAMGNIIVNSRRLVTYRDVHATLLSVLDYTGSGVGNVSRRAISLFQEIPANRTCKHADILNHWCTCLSWSHVNLDNSIVAKLSHQITAYLRTLLQPHEKLCHSLSVSRVTGVEKYTANDDVLRFKNTQGNKRTGIGEAVLSDTMKASSNMYQVTLQTTPGGGMFVFTVSHDVTKDVYTIDASEISRINKYGADGDCVHGLREIRKFCYCKT